MSCTRCSDRLCQPCWIQLLADLRLIAGEGLPTTLMQDLQVTVTRQNKTAPPGVGSGGGDDRPILFDQRASDCAGMLMVIIRTVARMMLQENDHLSVPEDESSAIARWLLVVRDLMRELPAITWVASAVRRVVDDSVKAIDLPVEHAYLGACTQCYRSIYVPLDGDGRLPTDHVVTCCGVDRDLEDLQAVLLDKLRGVRVTPTEAVGLVLAALGRRYKPDTIRRKLKKAEVEPWGLRGDTPVYDVIEIIELFKPKPLDTG